MLNRSVLANLGSHVYGLGGIALGLVGLVWGDFAEVWQPIQALGKVPHRTALAYVFAVCFLSGGLAAQWRRTAQTGVLMLSALHFISALFWLPRVIGVPRIYGTWAGFLEMSSLVAAGMVAYSFLASDNTSRSVTIAQVGRFFYGICVVSYGVAHFAALPQTARMVPKWIPPGQPFWAVATGVFDLLAAIAILSGIQAVLASRLLTAMIVGFGALVWAPALFANPREHIVWAGNAINLALIGAAWVVADWISSRRRQIQQVADLDAAMETTTT